MMNNPIILNTANAFRTNRGEAATGTVIPAPHDDDAPIRTPVPGAFTRQELRDLVLHWMG